MLAVEQYYDKLLIIDLIPYSIVTDPDTVLIFIYKWWADIIERG